jgi:hypothetical protein
MNTAFYKQMQCQMQVARHFMVLAECKKTESTSAVNNYDASSEAASPDRDNFRSLSGSTFDQEWIYGQCNRLVSFKPLKVDTSTI